MNDARPSTPSPSPSTRPAQAPLLLITGASRGIGAATAVRAASAGWDIAVHYRRDGPAAEQVANQVRALGRRAVLLPGAVEHDATVQGMFEQLDIWRETGVVGPLAGLVNNAGVVDRAQRVDEMSAERVQRLFAVNVFGAFSCAREAVRRMSTRHGGRGGVIVNVGSVAARLGSAGQYVDYAATKAALETLTLGLAHEVAREGVRVNAVRPGIIDTEIHASGGQPDRATRLAPLVPMERAGTADEVARSIVWLLSDDASYCTGSVLDVTGGR